jgi:TonB family protein
MGRLLLGFAVVSLSLTAFAKSGNDRASVGDDITISEPTGAQDTAPGQGSGAGQHGAYKVGGDVSAPVLIHSVEPKSPDGDASGIVQVNLWVDKNGNPSHVRVIHGLGMGLDEKAVEAVRQYKFKPGMKDGKPVLVEWNVEVKFQRSTN